MATATLVSFSRELEEAGWNFLEALDKANMDCSGLFYKQFEENDWRFYVVTDPVGKDPLGYRQELYQIVFRLNERDGALIIDAGIVLLNPNYSVVQSIRDRVGVVDNEAREIKYAYTNAGEVYVFRMR